MSTISATNSYFSTQNILTNLADEEAKTASAKKSGETTKANEDSVGSSDYSDDYVPSLSEALAMAMEGLGLGPNDRVTFGTIMSYRDTLEKDFASTVKTDLKDLEVEVDDFQLVTNEDGSIDVISGHADKAKIEQYFKDNPEMTDQFKQIQALSNLEEARKELNIDMSASRQTVQMEGLTTWFANTGQSVNSIMNFTSGGTSMFAGLNKLV